MKTTHISASNTVINNATDYVTHRILQTYNIPTLLNTQI